MKRTKFSIKFRIVPVVAMLFACIAVSAQQISVSGKVTDTAGEAIIGATVSETGTTNATMTDLDGNFALRNVSSNGSLQISSIGYLTQTISVNGRTTINVTLQDDGGINLNEVVAIGYGTVRKNDATGSLTAINADQMGKGLAPNAQDLMIGKVAGLSVVSGGGAPTDGSTIRIRGGSSLSASNDPLIVIDGVPLSNNLLGGLGSVLNSINPNDIETFTVLKDASATAIYGTRASNGVILITTKKGISGTGKGSTFRVQYDGNTSVSTKRNQIDVLNGDEFRDFVKTTFAGATNEGSVLAKLGTYNTDWQSQIFQTGLNVDHNLSVLGSVKDFMPYRISFGYTDMNGILKTSSMERYTGSISLAPTFFDRHLTVNINAKGMYIKNRFADRGAIGEAAAFDPTQPVYDANSPFGGYWSWIGADGHLIKVGTKNPVARLMMQQDDSKAYQVIANTQFDYSVHFLPDLHLNLNLAYDYSYSDGKTWRPLNSPVQNEEYEFLRTYNVTHKNPLVEFFAQYKKEFGINSIDLMAGHSYQSFYRESPTIERHIGAFNDDGTPVEIITKDPSELRLESYFGRINYGLLNRYLLTATIRTDGSSRFLQGHRWGLFPAAALAWRISEESFLKNSKAVSNLKLRLGWGITGQQDIGVGDYPALNTYQTSPGVAANYYIDGQWIGLIKPLAYNPILTWEKTTTYNAGLDFGFANNRINGSIDVYHRLTKDLINTDVWIAMGTNYKETVIANLGSLKNDGIEFAINAVPVAKKNFKWEFGFNAAYNRNEITQLALGDNKLASKRFESTGGDGSFFLKIHQVGQHAGMYYVYEQVYNEQGQPIEGLYVDRNNDGIIDDYDMYPYHNADPKIIFGFNTRLTIKRWDFSIASHGSYGNYNYNSIASRNAELAPARVFANEFLSNRFKSAFDANFQMKQVLSDYYIQDASFYRIDNITLGYSFPTIGQVKVAGRVYGSVQNPFVFTKYKGLDPEISGGKDDNFYPRPVTFMLGLNLSF